MSSSSDEINEIITDIVGYTAGTCAAIITIPQIYRIYRTRKANDVALWTIILLLITSALYTTYGVLIDSVPLIVTDTFAFILDVILLVLKLFFDHKTIQEQEKIEKEIGLEEA